MVPNMAPVRMLSRKLVQVITLIWIAAACLPTAQIWVQHALGNDITRQAMCLTGSERSVSAPTTNAASPNSSTDSSPADASHCPACMVSQWASPPVSGELQVQLPGQQAPPTTSVATADHRVNPRTLPPLRAPPAA